MVLAVLLAAGACKSVKPGYCEANSDCPAGEHCNLEWPDKFRCVGPPGVDGGDAGSPAGADTTVGCRGDGDCSGTTPICKSGACLGCGLATAAACAARDPSKAVCSPDGSCLECAASTDCYQDATKPVCVAGGCAGCGAGPAAWCTTRDPTRPACAPSGGCVECASSTDCIADPAKPICNLAANSCGPCQGDADCLAKGNGPGICMAHQDGRCASDAETIYVQFTPACTSDAILTAGTPSLPFCSMGPAVIALSMARRVVVVRGTVDGTSTIIQGIPSSSQVSIIGQNGGVLGPPTTHQPILHLTGGDVYFRDVTLKNSLDIGMVVDGGATLRLDGVTFDNDSGGGLLLDGAAFDIRNSVFTNNGPGTIGAVTWGGILVQGTSPPGPRNFAQVTIANNKQVGLSCSAAVSGSGIYAVGNAGGVDISPTCSVTTCPQVGAGCGAPP